MVCRPSSKPYRQLSFDPAMHRKVVPPSFGDWRSLRVAAVSPSFCEHPTLRAELLELFPDARLNMDLARLGDDRLVAFLSGHDVALVGLEHLTGDVLSALPDLKIVSKLGTGVDMLDLDVMAQRDIRLGWKAGANALSIAELVVGFALVALRKINASNMALRNGEEVRNRMGRLLTGRIVGLHGCGHIGQEVVRLLTPFGCRILAHDISDRSEFYAAHGVEAVTFDQLIDQSEILSIHVPLTPETRDLYGKEVFARMRTDSILINTARGEIVDEDALYEALTCGGIEAACSDVVRSEPLFDTPLLNLPNFLLTPHIGGSAAEARLAMGRVAIDGIFNNSVPVKGVPPFTDW